MSTAIATSPTPAMDALEGAFRRIDALGGASAVLGWDRLVMMPPGGAEARAEQSATLQVLSHELMTAPAMSDNIERAAGEELSDDRRANLREMRRRHAHATAVPADLVEAQSRAASRSETLWREARAQADFATVRDALTEVVRLTREEAAIKSEALGVSPYEALLDQYEPGGRLDRIGPLLDTLAAEIPPVLEAVLAHQDRRAPAAEPEGPFPVDRQRALAREVMATLGFDFRHGRLDETLHPFCGGVPDDVRVTTRYAETGFASGIMGVIHETGHALYEMGLPRHLRGQPAGDARGMVLHESQSLLMEMQACRSPEFLEYLAPRARDAFGIGDSEPSWSPENLFRLYTRVRRGFIRVEADAVSYPLHVILRFRLEQALLSGDLQVADLPGAWNDGMAELLGVRPPDDAKGCLQDIHWFDGAIGYFPTYTLGAMAAAQLFQAATAADPRILPAIGRGDFAPLLEWLRPNVHARASLDTTDQILQSATGAPLGTEAFLGHLRARYLAD